jgi:ribosomal-protein-alanine N-acetyltransferase
MVVPLVPAGRALLYAGFHRSDAQGVLSILRGPAVGDVAAIGAAAEEALALCPRGTTPLFLGPGAQSARADLEDRFPGSTGEGDRVAGADGPDVAAVARLGARLLAPAATSAAGAGPRPLYVRAPQAFTQRPAAQPAVAGLAIAPFAESDLAEVLEVEQAVFSDPWPRQFFLEEIRHPGSVAAVVRQRGILAGYLLAWRLDGEMHLGNLAVAPGQQRRGIGRSLLDWLVRQADDGGQERITLEVRASNFAAQELYRRFGFRAVAVRRGYYQDTGEDALVMMRDRGAPVS